MRNKQYLAILVEKNGKFKVKLAKKLNCINQFTNHWERVNARGFARKLNKTAIVIK